ncbi:uncharacterized protein VTP21DRAFT_7969 [Calcarisporiella thermophila]|uniref:uncharacterized protein n=1 Tax=Calcarisporiella thermophila TaxID=911321 RepID=UPI003742334E
MYFSRFFILISVLVALFSARFYKTIKHKVEILGLRRVVESYNIDKCQKIQGPIHCEDAAIHRPSGLVFLSCESDRYKTYPYCDNESEKSFGEIWVTSLDKDPSVPVKLSIPSISTPAFRPVGISVSDDEADPSKLTLAVINRYLPNNGTVEIFHYRIPEDSSTLSADGLVHHRTIRSPHIFSPNGLVVVDQRRGKDGTPSFFLTNDSYLSHVLLKVAEVLLGIPLTTVAFYDAQKDVVHTVISGLAFPNGIATDVSGQHVYVASTVTGDISEYSINWSHESPILKKTKSVYTGYALDNLDYEPKQGRVVAAAHPNAMEVMGMMGKCSELATMNRHPSSLVLSLDTPRNEWATVLSDPGANYSTSSTALIDADRKRMIVVGLLDKGYLDCHI